MATALNPRSLLLAALIALLVLAAAIAISKLSDLPNLPRTKHARNAHSGQAWDVESIIGELLGLVVSQATGKVITGYTARESCWTSKANFCTFMGPGSFAQ